MSITVTKKSDTIQLRNGMKAIVIQKHVVTAEEATMECEKHELKKPTKEQIDTIVEAARMYFKSQVDAIVSMTDYFPQGV